MITSDRHWWRSLRFKLVISTVLVEVLMLTVLVWNGVRLTEESLIRETEYRIREVLPLLNASMANAVVEEDIATLIDVVDQVVRDEGLHYLSVNDIWERKIVERGSAQVTGALKREMFSKARFREHIESGRSGNSYHFIAPLAIGGYQAGSVDISIDTRFIKRSMEDVRRQGILIAIVGVAISIVLLSLIGYKLTDKLAKLANAARGISSGDFSIRVPVTTHDEVGDSAYAFNAMVDQIERDQLQLRSSEQKYRRLVESLSTEYFVYTHDAEGVFTYVSPSVTDVLGYREEEFLVSYDTYFTDHPVNRAAHRSTLASIRGELQPSYEIDIFHKNGTAHRLEVTEVPIFDEEERVIAVEGIAHDITRRKQIERELRANEAHYRDLVESTSAIPWELELESFRFTYVGPQIVGLVGYSVEAWYEDSFWVDHLHPEDAEYAMNFCQASTARGQDHEFTYRIVKSDGKYLWIRDFVKVVIENGKPVRLRGFMFDITGQKLQEAALHRSQKMDALGKLTGGIAHDYNNMLGVIQGYAELLEDQLPEDLKLGRYATAIRRAGERGSQLTRKLLAFTRQQPAEAEAVDINEQILEDSNLIEKTLTARIELKLELVDALWPVWLDKGDLEDALLNISINAMHAMPEGGQLTLSTSNVQLTESDARAVELVEGEYVRLSITDTGTGMDEETQAQIFDPFFSTKEEKGTGLGLSQVYGFVQQSGGAVRVYSELGAGSRFSLYFPRYKGADIQQTKPDAGSSDAVDDWSGDETILVVDDEPALRTLAVEILGGQGYRVLCAESGELALEILAHEPVALMLSDVVMPTMDGYQLANKVRDLYPAVRIQLASGFSDNRQLGAVSEELHRTLLRKPYSSGLLLQRIRELLDQDK